MTPSSSLPSLPEGWFYPEDTDISANLQAELLRELSPDHLLFGHAVEVFAYRHGSDDVLFRHGDQPSRFTVIHLSWLGREEVNAQHPTVELDGSFDEFVAEEGKLYGLTPPDTEQG